MRCSRSALIALCLFAVGCAPRADLSEFRARSRRVGAENVQWTRLHSNAFDDNASINRARIVAGTWSVADGRLRSTAGERNRAILLHPQVALPLRITFDATMHAQPDGRIGDISVIVGGKDDSKQFWTGGYALTTGSYWNHCSTFYLHGEPIAKTEFSPVRDGKTHHVDVQIVANHIRYMLDGVIVLEAWDAEPFTVTDPADHWLGIRTWETDMTIDNFTVWTGRVVNED